MSRLRCDQCGELFNSAYNLQLHEEMDVCADKDEAQQKSQSTKDESQQKPQSTKTEPRRELPETELTGVITKYNKDRGFGFLATSDYTEDTLDGTAYTTDVFIHITDVNTNRLSKGDRIRFEIADTEKGYAAKNATVIEREDDREVEEVPKQDPAERLKFGQDLDETQYRPHLKPEPTESDIESFRDERKFR